MLEAKGLCKHYGSSLAVEGGVTFSLEPGQVPGYLGPNGAGKSTTVKMLNGLVEPSDGQMFSKGWDAIFLDRRDYHNLVPLPIGITSIFLANLSAILIVTGLYTIVANVASAC